MAALKDVSPLQLLLHQRISTKMSLKCVAHEHHYTSTYMYVLTDIGSFVIFCRITSVKNFLTLFKVHSPKLQCATSYCCFGNYVFLVWLNSEIFTDTMGSNSQNLWNAYLGEFLSLCLADQGEVIRATPLESVCFAHCTYHLVLDPRS